MNNLFFTNPIVIAVLLLGITIALVEGIPMSNQSALAYEDFDSPPNIPLVTQKPAQIIVDTPVPESLAMGLVILRYRAENVRLLPVYGQAAQEVSPRLGHLHITLDNAAWHWVDASGEPVIIQGLSPGTHKVLLELADPMHRVMDSKSIDFEIPQRRTAGS